MTIDPDDLRTLCVAAAGTDIAAAPPAVRQRVADLIVDTIAVAALGSTRPELAALAASVEPLTPEGPATVVGSPRSWPATTAAWLNGSAVAADQLQDGHRMARGHPASHVVPAVFALAEASDRSSAELMSAVLAGYEVGARIGCTMGGTPPGVHDIGSWGQLAVAAGVARLLAPGDAAAMHRAIELSAAAVLLTDAHTVFTGHSGSHVFLGASIQHGLTTALAAVAGLDAGPDAMRRHFRAVAAAAPTPIDLGVCSSGWQRYEVLAGYLKAHPTCAHLHGVNDAVADLLADGLDAADVSEVDVAVFAGAAGFGSIARSELEARFSIPSSVAVAVLTGRLDETTMTDEIVRSTPVRALADRVRTHHDPALDAGYPDGRPARVRIVLADGSVRTATAGRPRWDADRLPAAGAPAAKHRRLFRHRFGAAADGLLTDVRSLGAADDRPVREVGAALRRGAGGGVPPG